MEVEDKRKLGFNGFDRYFETGDQYRYVPIFLIYRLVLTDISIYRSAYCDSD